MLLLLVLGPVLLPEFCEHSGAPLDLMSMALSLLAVLAIIYGIKQFAQDGVGWLPLSALVAGLILGAVFIHRQQRLAQPLIDLQLFRSSAFSAVLAMNTLGFFVTFAGFL